MITPGRPGEGGGKRIELRQSEASLALVICSPQENLTWEVIDTEKPRNEWDSPNRGTRMVAFHVVAPQSGALSMSVVLTPGSITMPADAALAMRPLERWGR